ncbi:MAG: thioredoxin domain-containing protein [Candidatus Omnitrophica bacterium]|nr:thioredoxin domain-containing protein [Candidatus Omnitrophota bacterium]
MFRPSKKIIIWFSVLAAITAVSLFIVYKISSVKSFVHAQGKIDAPVQIVEYMDYECPGCALGGKYLKEMIQKYPEKIRLEVHFYPLNNHRQALLAARYAECSSRQNKFWEFHEALIFEQSKWIVLFDVKPAFNSIAQRVGLDFERLNACLQDRDILTSILAGKLKGIEKGVHATPTYFVNGKMVVGPDKLKVELEGLLKK